MITTPSPPPPLCAFSPWDPSHPDSSQQDPSHSGLIPHWTPPTQSLSHQDSAHPGLLPPGGSPTRDSHPGTGASWGTTGSRHCRKNVTPPRLSYSALPLPSVMICGLDPLSLSINPVCSIHRVCPKSDRSPPPLQLPPSPGLSSHQDHDSRPPTDLLRPLRPPPTPPPTAARWSFQKARQTMSEIPVSQSRSRSPDGGPRRPMVPPPWGPL